MSEIDQLRNAVTILQKEVDLLTKMLDVTCERLNKLENDMLQANPGGTVAAYARAYQRSETTKHKPAV